MAQLHVLAMILANNQRGKAAYLLSLTSPALAFDQELNRALIKTKYFENEVLEKNQIVQDLKMFELGAGRFQFFVSCGYTIEPNALFHATYKKNYQLVKFLVTAGVDVNWKYNDPDGENETLLMFATRWGNGLQYLNHFVKNGADINGTDSDGATALMVASWHGRTEIVRYLIEKGADVNAKGGAAYFGMFDKEIFLPVLKLLFKHGADINARDEFGETLLHKACSHKKCSYALVEILLDAGADVNARDEQSITPFMIAIGNMDCSLFTMQLLLNRGADIHLRRWNTETCLDRTIFYERFDVAFLMMKHDWETHDRKTSLIQVIKHCFPAEIRNDIVAWLLRNGADIDEPDEQEKQTPLILAARMVRDVSLFELLIDAGANIMHVDAKGHTAFYYAAMHLQTSVVKLMARRCGRVLLTKSEKAEIIKMNGLEESQKLIKTLYKLGSIDEMSMEQLKV